ncbi:MAG: hypothetical protein GIW94_06820 [Candidatus Eremiobacteraeota bacterium]|nr:hypothetical protein [Candidatus Eremiobacteraeota bacterium]
MHGENPDAGLFQGRLQATLHVQRAGIIGDRPGDPRSTALTCQPKRGRGQRTAPAEEPGTATFQIRRERADGGAEIRRAAGIGAQACGGRRIEDQRRYDLPVTRRGRQTGVVVEPQIAVEQEKATRGSGYCYNDST